MLIVADKGTRQSDKMPERRTMPHPKRHLHLNIQATYPGHSAGWRTEEGRRLPGEDVAHFQAVARAAEKALLNAVFQADSPSFTDTNDVPTRSLDPVVLAAAGALVTERVGFILTASTTFNHPYNLARQFLSLDQLSKGRIGWNIVTTTDERASRNFGLAAMPPNDERYAIAADFTDAVVKLWDSWEDGALLGDPNSGVWADTNRIHPVNHVGPHFSTAGPLQVPRSPQGRPLLVQAGSSPQGRDFAARYAEAIFSVQTVREEAIAYYADVKERIRRHGRDPDKVAILPGLSLVIGGTEAEAHARLAELDQIANGRPALETFALSLGLDPADLDFEKPFPEHLIAKVEGSPWLRRSTGHNEARIRLLRERTLTVRQIIARGSGGHYRLVGTPEQIADFMEDWADAGAADGFNLFMDIYPSGLTAFADHVVPILQRRGLHRREYEGRTLRDHYGLERPPNALVRPSQPAGEPPMQAAD
jgi:FMN-dependent oxidoreductase (nitrilotriacetate monooxygenase family)